MKNPVISIIIPIYNVEKFVNQCLSSIYSQKVSEELFEVIVVNDGTHDNSMDIVRQYICHTNLTIIEQKNQGLSVARNTGLAAAKGDYLWFVDSDDWLLEDSLNIIFKYINRYKSVDLFSTILENHYEDTGVIEKEYDPDIKHLSGKEYLQRSYRQGASQRFIIKRGFLEYHKLSFEPGILHEDSLFGYIMLYFANNIMILDKPVYAYRIRTSGSIMSSVSIKSAKDLLYIHKKLTGFMDIYVANSDKVWYRNRIFSILDCIFGFSRYIIDTPEFRKFYRENKKYIRECTKPLLYNINTLAFGLRMYFFPCLYYRARVFLRKVL